MNAGRESGFHGHNNLQLASANALAAGVENGWQPPGRLLDRGGWVAQRRRIRAFRVDDPDPQARRLRSHATISWKCCGCSERVISPVLRPSQRLDGRRRRQVTPAFTRVCWGRSMSCRRSTRSRSIAPCCMPTRTRRLLTDDRVQLEELAGHLAEESPRAAGPPQRDNFLLTLDRRCMPARTPSKIPFVRSTTWWAHEQKYPGEKSQLARWPLCCTSARFRSTSST